mmetsp:Transcript_26195/g.36923  ORF Transcript_26195/g.36923 Transcript_26195/m.36923 type:complete len:365 (-) Transcript_26195:223-1317(-)
MPAIPLTRQELKTSFPSELQTKTMQIPSREILECLATMRKQERSYNPCIDYLAEHSAYMAAYSTEPVNELCRDKMCSWYYQVIDCIKFSRETAAIGLSYLDRFLSTTAGKKSLLSRREFQLAAMTTLYVAIKLHEPIEMDIQLVVHLGRGCYSETEISEKEMDILFALQWKMHSPTPICFASKMVELLPWEVNRNDVAESILTYARHQAQLAVSDYSFVVYPASQVAFASILNALEGLTYDRMSLGHRAQFIRDIEEYSCIAIESVQEIKAKLTLLVMKSVGHHHQAHPLPPTPVSPQPLEHQHQHPVEKTSSLCNPQSTTPIMNINNNTNNTRKARHDSQSNDNNRGHSSPICVRKGEHHVSS